MEVRWLSEWGEDANTLLSSPLGLPHLIAHKNVEELCENDRVRPLIVLQEAPCDQQIALFGPSRETIDEFLADMKKRRVRCRIYCTPTVHSPKRRETFSSVGYVEPADAEWPSTNTSCVSHRFLPLLKI